MSCTSQLYVPFCLGDSVLSGQFNNLSSPGSEISVNVSQFQDQNDEKTDVMNFLTNENINVTNGLANVTAQLLCSDTAVAIRDALSTLPTFTSLDILCGECGQLNHSS